MNNRCRMPERMRHFFWRTGISALRSSCANSMGGDFTNTEALVREMYDKVMQVSDLDWSEICTKYNCAMHPDHLRKMGAGIKLAAEAGMLNLRGKSGDSASDVQKMRDLRNEISEACRVQARSEALREAVIQAVKELPALHAEPLPAHAQADRS